MLPLGRLWRRTRTWGTPLQWSSLAFAASLASISLAWFHTPNLEALTALSSEEAISHAYWSALHVLGWLSAVISGGTGIAAFKYRDPCDVSSPIPLILLRRLAIGTLLGVAAAATLGSIFTLGVWA